AVKNALSAAANLLAAVIFAFSGEVRWALAGAVALGALVGGHLGALLGRRIPDRLLRTVMAIVGLLAAASVLMN
ncbi:MAG: TSUP family transporter, partial [Candidatus Microthrix parvicella]